MTFILTHSGVEFDFRHPTPEMINLRDIAHALSNIKRFNGHTNVNCSVALHSVILSHAVPEEYAKQALLHGAHEAYIGDITKPLKQMLGPRVAELEICIDAAVSERFGVDMNHNSVVRLFDLRHLRYEKEHFLETFGKPWPCLEGIHALKVPEELAIRYYSLDPPEHEELFLERCRELGVCHV